MCHITRAAYKVGFGFLLKSCRDPSLQPLQSDSSNEESQPAFVERKKKNKVIFKNPLHLDIMFSTFAQFDHSLR